jgi:hypothetical protein
MLVAFVEENNSGECHFDVPICFKYMVPDKKVLSYKLQASCFCTHQTMALLIS